MHYNFETKAALDPSLMFLEMEGTLLTSALPLKQRGKMLFGVGGKWDKVVYVSVRQQRPH